MLGKDMMIMEGMKVKHMKVEMDRDMQIKITAEMEEQDNKVSMNSKTTNR